MEGIKIVILNGSPKGRISVTMQYIHYLELRFPHHNFEYVNAAQSCAKFERNEAAFNEVMDKIEAADLILWAYPLYFLLVCSQYKRFIELIFERNRKNVFTGKYTAALSTSIHFFDNTALNYIHSVCDDLGTNFLNGITAKMDDLQSPAFRDSFDRLFLEWEHAARCSMPACRAYAPVTPSAFSFNPEGTATQPAPVPGGTRICIVGDLEDGGSSIRKMAQLAAAKSPGTDIFDLSRLKFGPCTGCLKCGFDNICAYEEKDDLIRLHRETVLAADVIIFAGEIHDRYLSSIWQRYLERTFNRTHQPTLTGKQVGFIISGPLSQNHNTREILQAYTEAMGGCNAGFVTDECADNSRISAEIENLLHQTASRAAAGVTMPKSFLGVGGAKIFRDDIYSHLRFVFQADHKYYKKHGLYDFPQKNLKIRFITGVAMLLTKVPPMRKLIRQKLRPGMITPYKRLFERVVPYKG